MNVLKQTFFMGVRDRHGDLFIDTEDYALAHCVAADFYMGAGIAVIFK